MQLVPILPTNFKQERFLGVSFEEFILNTIWKDVWWYRTWRWREV